MGFGECGLKYFGNLFWLEMEKGKQKDKIPNEKNVIHNPFTWKLISVNILCILSAFLFLLVCKQNEGNSISYVIACPHLINILLQNGKLCGH